ncbi:alkaline phosphatase D family protein [Croceitalea rosinachiae]|uniref:Alkaline phosphatase D family protein n=1 Tax=Croceitalea rosinachiae TaxID=3075596 RepID=A0ABU3A9M4_9FLAO|nr:alkaline phosphatase D family protein [Croceitalea sp. F388]MDT0606876.1 alkaline phosphatase D family protein [Croceitalea sp. F388]
MERKVQSRRAFLAKSILASGGVILASQLAACEKLDDFLGGGNDDDGIPRFLHGVGSFDPIANAVIIWTRFTPTADEVQQAIRINWQMATDIDFQNIVKEGMQYANLENDFTIVQDVTGLNSNGKYYYRFMQEDVAVTSMTGETITLPEAGVPVDNLKVAVCSCSNYPAGLFNVYDAIANSDADLVLHLGDYIYEYQVGGYGTNENTSVLGREHDPATEILSLEDYRLRYRQYRTDEGLQLAHQKKPFVVIWDDHEITNDAYNEGAENHDESEGDYQARLQRAIQVHSEYLPVRTDTLGVIYRNFEYGNLVNLVMLDTRIIGRDKQLSFTDFFGADGAFDFVGFAGALGDSGRALMGQEQLAWTANAVGGSSAKWQVLGQQVLMGTMTVPAELLILIGQVAAGDTSPDTLGALQTAIVDLSTLKARALAGDPTLTEAELGRLAAQVPYNLDAWDGYAVEREQLYAILNGKSTVVFAGDTHNAWHNVLTDFSGNKVGEEFACSSVTSPGFEGIFGTDPATIAGIEQAFTLLIDGLQYFDAKQRGYVLAEFTQGAATASYRFIDTIGSAAYTEIEGNTATYSG